MCTNKYWAFVLLLLSIVPATVFCQEIKGDTVYTSATQQTVLYFPSKVTSVAYEEKSGVARVDTIIDNSLVSLRAKIINAAPTVINITEGNRSHSIVVAYKPELADDELHHNWNDLNELARFVSNSDKKNMAASSKIKKQNAKAKNSSADSFANVGATNPVEEDYNDLLVQSYDLVQKKNFAESKKLYDKAMTLKDKKFNDDLNKANNFYAAKNYEEAKITYLLALSIKPDDAFARKRLKESQRLSATTATANNPAEKISAGKNAGAQPAFYNQQNIPASKKHAENIKSDTIDKPALASVTVDNLLKKLPENKNADTNVANVGQPGKMPVGKKQAEKIKSQPVALQVSDKTESETVTSAMSEQEPDFDENYAGNDKYDSTVARATKLFNNKSYAEALELYRKAGELRPKEDLPPKMIRFVNEVTSHSSEEQKRDKDFRNKARIIEIKDLGTEAIINKDWQKAKLLYTEMLTLNPIKNDEEFARKKIETIDLQLEKLANMKPVEKEPEVVLAPPKNRREARERRLLAERNAILASGSKKAVAVAAQPSANIASVGYTVPVANNKNSTTTPAVTGSRGTISYWTINQFSSDFKKADNVHWTAYPNFYKVNFVQDEDKVEAFYDINNMLIGTSRNINTARLPVVARKNFVKNYPAYTINEVIYFEGAEQAAYYISAAQGKEKVVLKASADNNYKLQPVKELLVMPDNTVALNSSANMQSSAISYTHEDLVKKYPEFNFNEMPAGQLYDTTDVKNRLQHYEFSKKVLAETAQLNLADSNNDVKVICQNIVFNGKNAYLKLLIQNKSQRSDFLAGATQLSLLKSNGVLQKHDPDFISDFPVVMPQKEFAVVYVTDDFANVSANDIFYLEMNDRTKKNKLTIAIPGNIYLKQKAL